MGADMIGCRRDFLAILHILNFRFGLALVPFHTFGVLKCLVLYQDFFRWTFPEIKSIQERD
jgi:hypothetical protein